MKIIHCLYSEEPCQQYFPDIFGNDGNIAPAIKPADFYKGIVVMNGTQLAGRIALFINPAVNDDQRPVMLGGYFRCIEDSNAAAALLQAATEAAGIAGMDYLIAPVNGSTWNDYRLPLTGNAPAFRGDSPHALYYQQLFRENGFEVIERYYSYKATLPDHIADEALITAELQEPAISIRHLDMATYENELRILYPVCNIAFAANPLFTSLSEEEFIARNLPLKGIIDSGRTLMAFDNNGLLLAL